MGVDGMNSADVFDEYFDDEKPKYIIKNCPAYDEGDCISPIEHISHATACQHIEGCKLKQIVELCKENLNSLETYVDVRSLECVTLQNILKLLDIQEVE